MPDVADSSWMATAVEYLKYTSGFVLAIAPVVKTLWNPKTGGGKRLDERFQRLKAFFVEGSTDMHPLLAETAFGAAVGHTRFSAQEIALIVQQRNPSNFMREYLYARGHLAFSSDGKTLVLKPVANLEPLRKLLVGLGLGMYGVFVFGAVWLALYAAPGLAMAGDWVGFSSHLFLAVLCAGSGAVTLRSAGGLRWAAALVKRQREQRSPA